MAVKVFETPHWIETVFSGELTVEDSRLAVELVSKLEKNEQNTKDRLADLTLVEEISLNFDTIFQAKEIRQSQPMKGMSKTAIVIVNDIQYGFARMWQNIRSNAQVSVQIFENREEAIAWLLYPK